MMLPQGMPAPNKPEIFSSQEVDALLTEIETDLDTSPTPAVGTKMKQRFDSIMEHTLSTKNWTDEVRKRWGNLFARFESKYPAREMPPRRPDKQCHKPLPNPKQDEKKPPKPPRPPAPPPKPKKVRKSRDDVNCNHLPGYLDILSGRLHDRIMEECEFDTRNCQSVGDALQTIVNLAEKPEFDPEERSQEVETVIDSIEIPPKEADVSITIKIRSILRILLISDDLIIAEED